MAKITKLCSFYGGTFQDVKFHNLAMILEFISRRNVLMLNIFMYIGINSNDFWIMKFYKLAFLE